MHPFAVVWEDIKAWFLAPLSPMDPLTLFVSVGIVLASVMIWTFVLAHMVHDVSEV